MFLVGMLLGPGGRFFKLGPSLHSGEIHLARSQICAPLLRSHDRGLRPIGRTIHIEDGPDGVYIVAEVHDPTFTANDHRQWLSCQFAGSHATSAVGMNIRFDNVLLQEISVVDKPGATNTVPWQLTRLNPTRHRGGYSWGTSQAHARVLGRCYDAFHKAPYRRSLGAIEVLDPLVSLTTRPPKPPGGTPRLDKVRAMLDGGLTPAAPAAATSHHREDPVPPELATTGRVMHRRTFDGDRLVAASAVVKK